MDCKQSPMMVFAQRWITSKILRVTDYLQINAFPDLVLVEQEECPRTLQKKATKGATSKVVRETADRTRPRLTFGTLTSVSTIHHTTK